VKFYEFTGEMPYWAVVWAKDEKQAFDKYEEEVCDLDSGERDLELPTMDVDAVLEKMQIEDYENDKEAKTIGVGGLLINIINSKEPRAIFIDGSLT